MKQDTVAKLVRHESAKLKIAGSNPVGVSLKNEKGVIYERKLY